MRRYQNWLTFACASLLGWLNVHANPPDDTPPLPDYRGWTHVKSVVVGPKSAAFQTEGGIHHIYANKAAMEGFRTGRFPNGSVLVYDLLEVKEADGVAAEGPRRRIDLMTKDSERNRDTGGWGFRRFLGADRRDAELTPEARASCFKCHESRNDRDFVFSSFRE